MKRKLIWAKMLALVFTILLIINIFQIDFGDIRRSDSFNIVGNLLGIILMVINIKEIKNAKK